MLVPLGHADVERPTDGRRERGEIGRALAVAERLDVGEEPARERMDDEREPALAPRPVRAYKPVDLCQNSKIEVFLALRAAKSAGNRRPIA